MKTDEQVLVTGASGFIAKHCIVRLLNDGYRVRGSLRSLNRADEVKSAIAPQADVGRLEFVTLDLMSDEGWDAAANGCTYVLHVASPFPAYRPKHEDELIIPARDGVLRALNAAAKAGVKRTVLTSSIAAVSYGQPDHAPGVPFDESNWTNVEKAKSAYIKSKTIAERAAWDFIDSDAAGDMDLAVINPGAVLGPLLDKTYSTSGELIYKLIAGQVPASPHVGFSVIDVRDVADAHVEAMIRPEAGGKRFCCISDFAWMQDIALVLRAHGYKAPKGRLPNFALRLMALFDPAVRLLVSELDKRTDIDNTRLKTVLGIEPRTMEEMSLAMAATMKSFGVV